MIESLERSRYVQASSELLTKLEEAKESLEKLFERTSNLFCIITSDGRILKCNLHFAEFFDMSIEDLTNINLFSLFSDVSAKLKFEKVIERMNTDTSIEKLNHQGTIHSKSTFFWQIQNNI